MVSPPGVANLSWWVKFVPLYTISDWEQEILPDLGSYNFGLDSNGLGLLSRNSMFSSAYNYCAY